MRFPPFTTPMSRRRLALIALAAAGAPAVAQTTQTAPANAQLPQTIPGLDNFTIAPTRPLPMPVPTPTPTPAPVVPVRPLPTPTPAPAARATPRPARTPSPAPTPAPPPAPVATPRPSASPTVAPPPSPTPIPTPTATATPTPVPAAVPTAAPRHSLLWIALFIALLLLPALGVVLWFLRRSQWSSAAPAEAIEDDDDDWVAPEQVASPPAPGPVAPPRHLPGTSARPRLEIAFTPRSAGLNGTNAAVDYDLLIRNTGDLAAEQVQLSVELITAGNAHDSELQARLGQPLPKPMIAPFTLAAGQQRPLRALAQAPKSAINVVTVKDRPMFVPIVVVDLRYRWPTGEGQTAQSFVIGIAPKAGDRMRPFWLDVAPRMHDTVVARPHAVGAKR